ncbi:hypothetical protein ES288_D10G119500v1 [Gossypium darwinii]|nr:hypothetical protein GOBAR_DD01451 [Gossypium barbadense]TYG49751.1 hypothetical protein ES288_D10G119500v1 [Gossypium darwinii]TYH49230.1 hypothetical protein ES332_D10G121700v1 [Gossypium tomentosum]
MSIMPLVGISFLFISSLSLERIKRNFTLSSVSSVSKIKSFQHPPSLQTHQKETMSIVPINGQQGTPTDPFSLELWDPFNNLDVLNPFSHSFPFPFPSFLSTHFPGFSSEIFPSLGTQLNCVETPRAHVYKAYLPGVTRDEVLVFIDDDRMLQISTENGNFMSRFKLPDNARTDEIEGFMENGMLIVTIGKQTQAPERPNVRVVEITE